ncbi:hypothetical protein ATANTOWER_007652 [Ataeniobius toweri]|uniref:Uncharacterized protein n=1 Tax=Ataeniobius toweri TaxID=208326 RepID=A0ABU7A5W7_9TELE|nr:hypothetical protein [Ataeniobius toweri]
MSLTEKQRAANKKPCNNPGNPVFSCMMNLTVKGEESATIKSQSILYRTTSSDYGRLPPTVESSPCSYHPRSQTFSKQLSLGGMFQDNSFNTSLHQSHPNVHHSI